MPPRSTGQVFLRRLALVLMLVIGLSGCSSSTPESPPEVAPLETLPDLVIQPGWSLWLTYSVYNTTMFQFQWDVREDVPVQFTFYRTKSTGEDVLYTSTAPADSGNVTARHPNIHAFVWRNTTDQNVTLGVRLPPGYEGARYEPGTDPATSNCPPAFC